MKESFNWREKGGESNPGHFKKEGTKSNRTLLVQVMADLEEVLSGG